MTTAPSTLPLTFSAEVATARESGAPIVALESTIITHGMPYPQNLEVARQVEQDIRDAGAVPATIAVIRGALHIGLNDDQLSDLAQAKDVAKLSRADMAVCLALIHIGRRRRTNLGRSRLSPYHSQKKHIT